jgi:hypothetical protein
VGSGIEKWAILGLFMDFRWADVAFSVILLIARCLVASFRSRIRRYAF